MKIDKRCSCGNHVTELPEKTRLWALGEKIFKIFECSACGSTLQIVTGFNYGAKKLEEQFRKAMSK